MKPWDLLRQPSTVNVSQSYPADLRNVIATFKVPATELAGLLAWMCSEPDDDGPGPCPHGLLTGCSCGWPRSAWLSSTSGPGLRDGIRERPSTWPPDSGDPVESRNLPAAPPEVGDDPAGSDGSTATRGPAVGTGESTGPTSFDFIVGAHHDVRPDRSRNIGVEDHSAFPVGEWTRVYVPTARLDECCAALDAVLSGAHAPDPVDDTTTELDDTVWVRSTGRGTHDVMLAANPVPIVLASIMFTEGVKGRALALERFAAALGSVSQDVQR